MIMIMMIIIIIIGFRFSLVRATLNCFLMLLWSRVCDLRICGGMGDACALYHWHVQELG